MKKTVLTCVLVSLLLGLLAPGAAQAEVDFDQKLYQKLAQNKNEIPYIDMPTYTRVEFDNRMVVYLVENKQLPIVEISGYIRGGRTQETKKIAGISSFMFEMMNTGTQNLKEQEFNRYKELHGIDVGFNVSQDYYSFSADALSTDRKELVSLLADILRRPNFGADYYSRIKQERIRSLEQAKTQQSSLLNMYYYKHIYGNHPYSFGSNINVKKQAVKNITQQQLKKFYNHNIAPNNIVLGVIGNFEAEAMAKLLKREFEGWKQKEIEIKAPELENKPSKLKNKAKVILVNKSDATQAEIRMGYKFFDYRFKDQVAFDMANRVYGGGDFSSRLMKNLRSEKGYVYGVYAKTNYNQLGGNYYINTSVKPTKSLAAIRAIKEEMKAIKSGEQPIKRNELFKIVNLYNGLLPKSYESKQGVLNNIIYNSEIRGRRPDYVNQFITEYNQLTFKEAQKTFKQYTYPDRLLTVIVGNKQDILPQFKEAGIKVKVVEPNK